MVDLLSPRRSRILIVNDDGPEAKGVQTLARKLSQVGDVLVCLPFSSLIHPSFSITTNDTCTAIFREKQSSAHVQTWAVLRTPIDCVKFGIHHLCQEKMGWDRPDIVVSGINHGANVGTELLYSGTIAAAFGARFENSVPAIAISQEIPDGIDPDDIDFGPAATLAEHLVDLVLKRGLPPNTIWNVNIPHKTRTDGNFIVCAVTRPALLVPTGKAVKVDIQRMSETKIEFSIPLRQYGNVSQPFGTDVAALDKGVVSITPLHLQSDLHCPSKASLSLKNSIKFHSILKLDMDHSWDTEFPKHRAKIVNQSLKFLVDLSKQESIPMYLAVQRINETLYQCEHYMGRELRQLLEGFGYREMGGFSSLTREQFEALTREFANLINFPGEFTRKEQHGVLNLQTVAAVAIGVIAGVTFCRLLDRPIPTT